MMNLFEPVINYCERTSHALLAEPLNAISNISFFIAAWLLYKGQQSTPKDRPAAVLIFLVLLVGIGSTLFHTFANNLAMFADIIPIMMFVLYYLWTAMHRLLGFTHPQSAFALVLFFAAGFLCGKVPPEWSFNGSIAYFPCLAALLLMGWRLRVMRHPAAPAMLKAAGLFIISLTFRSTDYVVCAWLPSGVHFFWHLCNGALLYLLTRIIINFPRTA